MAVFALNWRYLCFLKYNTKFSQYYLSSLFWASAQKWEHERGLSGRVGGKSSLFANQIIFSWLSSCFVWQGWILSPIYFEGFLYWAPVQKVVFANLGGLFSYGS